MAKRHNYETVKDATAFNSKSFNQRRVQRFQPLLNLNYRLRRHPIIFWGIIWSSIALPSGFAIGSLINPDSESSPTVVAIAQNLDSKAVKPASQLATESGQLPLWVFGAIAVGCTASCFILAQHIKPVETDVSEAEVDGEISVEELIPLSQRSVEERSQHQINSSKQSLKRLKPYELTEALPFMQPERSQQIQPLALEWVAATQQLVDSAYLPIDGVSESVSVAKIPTGETQPLDWGEARLADAMDLRRRYPLHLIANNKSQS